METFQRNTVARSARRRGQVLRGRRGKRAAGEGSRRMRTLGLRGFETMEARCLLAADLLHVGAVYTEADLGSDAHGDTFEVTFTGGAPGTELTRLLIDGDQGASGFGEGDVFFDTEHSGLGADEAFGFTILDLETQDPAATVTASVLDGGLQLELQFSGFRAGDRLLFTIDVDEVEYLDPAETDLTIINDGFDPITSGIEFQSSRLTSWFSAPHYHDVSGETEFFNRYDQRLEGTSLSLPEDNYQGLRDRTAGAVNSLVQTPKPIAISGTVYLDNDLNLTRSSAEEGIAGVSLSLWQWDGNTYRDTGLSTTTDSAGRYEFGRDLNLPPGTYQVRETQPDGLFSVGAVAGRVAGQPVGSPATGDPDVLTDIEIPLGDLEATGYDFAEASPSCLSGYVFHDRNDNGLRDAGEEGISGVQVRIVPVDTIAPQTAITLETDADGFYQACDLPPGEYRVVQVSQPDGYLDGQDTAGRVDGVPTGTVDPAGDAIQAIQLPGGADGRDYNFGELLPVGISGHVRLTDAAGDCWDETAQSTPLSGVTVILSDELGQQVAVTQTDALGFYEFTGLQPGRYSVEELTPEGLFDGAERVGTVNGQTRGRVAGDDRIADILLASGETATDYDFCESAPSSLAGRVYHDRNDNGRRDAGEEPLGGVTLVLREAGGGEVARTTTSADGTYRFEQLPAGRYSIEQQQPAGWLDGRDAPGQIDGVTRGTARPAADVIDQIALGWGQQGVEYNFGELLPVGISGRVHADLDGDCRFDPGETPLADVRIELLDDAGNVLRTALTDNQGRYAFLDLPPGEYAVREIQPEGYFDGGRTAGPQGELLDGNLFDSLVLTSGTRLDGYDFCEVPPASLSGYVFQDGPELVTNDGLPPANLFELVDGQRTPDDLPIAGVVMELRDGVTGEPIDASAALPGTYGAGPIRAVTDASGAYAFPGLRPGLYSVYQVHPSGWFDSLDTPGSTSGVAVNAGVEIPAEVLEQLLVSPGNDAILRIPLVAGGQSTDNNFSEVAVSRTPRREIPPVNEPAPLPPVPVVEPVTSVVLPPVSVVVPPPSLLRIPQYGSGAIPTVTWHLSVLDGGSPRGRQPESVAKLSTQAEVHLTSTNWSTLGLRRGVWLLPMGEADDASRAVDEGDLWAATSTRPEPASLDEFLFGLPGAIPVSGDFDGDGDSDLGVFFNGQWYIDLNGNGRWDSEDLWAKLGGEADIPVTGDWDGDGKDDIGIFGPMWSGDARAVRSEPGVPDSNNPPKERPKNVPPTEREATDGRRLLKRSATGEPRGDVIDHVFRFGLSDDHPLAGDWNGDGIDTIGVFRNGKWHLDTNGDGRWSDADEVAWFGGEGDVPVVGDFNGDGIDEIGVFRDGTWKIDSDGDRKLTARDQVFQLGGPHDTPVVGDWNGDGIDDPGLYQQDDS